MVLEHRAGRLAHDPPAGGRHAGGVETTYTWADAGEGATVMSLRNRGEPAGFAGVAVPVMAGSMARANKDDLRRPKAILERHDG